jgi:hypothetical protein
LMYSVFLTPGPTWRAMKPPPLQGNIRPPKDSQGRDSASSMTLDQMIYCLT